MSGNRSTEDHQSPSPTVMRARSLLTLYPRAWRLRYERELGDILADTPLSPRLAADLLLGALDAYLWPQLGRPAAMRPWLALIVTLLIAFSLATGLALRSDAIARASANLADQLRPPAATTESVLSDTGQPPLTVRQAES